MPNHVHIIATPETEDGVRRAIGVSGRGMVRRAEKYKWRCARAHLRSKDDILVKMNPLLKINPNWNELLFSQSSEEEYNLLRRHKRSGRPLGSEVFLDTLKNFTSRIRKKQKPGPKTDN